MRLINNCQLFGTGWTVGLSTVWNRLSGFWSMIGDRWFHGSLVHKMRRLVFRRWSMIGDRFNCLEPVERFLINNRWSDCTTTCYTTCVETIDWSVIGDRWSVIVRQNLLHQMRRNGRWSMIGDRWSVIDDRWSMIGDRTTSWYIKCVGWSMIGDRWSVIDDRVIEDRSTI